jgi:hypothetical protein
MFGCLSVRAKEQCAPNLRLETPLRTTAEPRAIPELTSEIIEYGFWMRKEGYAETTIER